MAAKPADEVPDEFKEDVAKLHKPLAAILVGKEIPWAAQAWAHGDTSRWRSWRTAGTPQRRQGRMAPGPGIPGWGERVQCPDLGLHGDAPPSGSPGGCQLCSGGQPRSKAPLEVLCDRRQLEDAYVAIHGTPKPRLEFQGSDGSSRSSGV